MYKTKNRKKVTKIFSTHLKQQEKKKKENRTFIEGRGSIIPKTGLEEYLNFLLVFQISIISREPSKQPSSLADLVIHISDITYNSGL